MDHSTPSLAQVLPLLVTGAAFLLGVGMLSRDGRGPDAFRWPTVALLFVASMAHVPVVPEHLDEAPYMGVLFILFVVASFALAALLAARPAPPLYSAATALCAAAIVAYAATRLVSFPELADDVGNWAEPLGLVSVTSEAGVVLLGVLARARGTQARVPSGCL
jgi:hypothetical protein